MSAAELVKALGGHRAGRDWMAQCPAHDDREPSLAIREGRDGKVLLKCHAGCGQWEVVGALKERGITLPWDFDAALAPAADELNPTNAAALAQVGEAIEAEESDAIEFGRSEADITTTVDVSAFVDAKRRSMDCHKTQRQDLGWLLDLPDDLAHDAIDNEYYVLRWLDGTDVPTSHRETWLLG